MSERFSRRQLFQKTADVVTGLAFAFDLGFSARLFQTRYEITQDDWARIEQVAQEAAPYIRFEGHQALRLQRDDGRLIAVHPSSEAFAQAILLMAHREGGREAVAFMGQTIRQRTIEVFVGDPPGIPGSRGGVENPFLDTEKPLRVWLAPAVVEEFHRAPENSGDTTSHELYHVYQIMRDNNRLLALQCLVNLAFVYVGIRASEAFINYLNEQNGDRSSRRDFITRIGTYALVVPSVFLSPVEAQAYMQTEKIFPGSTVNNLAFDIVRDKLFTFE